MSFVVKAVKKKFKKLVSFTKRLLKNKWFQIALIAAITVFTAGVGAVGGWAAFSAQAFGSGIGGFFSTVGTTMAQGFSSIVAGVKSLGTAAKGWLTGGGAQAGTTAATNATVTTATAGEIGTAGIGIEGVTAAEAAASSSGVLSAANQAAAVTAQQGAAAGMTATTAAQGTAGLSNVAGLIVNNPATQQAQKGIVSRVLGAFASDTVGGSALRMGAMMGFQAYSNSAAAAREQRISNRRYIAGGEARGGSAEYGYSPLQIASDVQDTSKKTFSGNRAQELVAQTDEKIKTGFEQDKGGKSPFLLDAPPAFQTPAATAMEAQLAQQEAPQGDTQAPAATQPDEGRDMYGGLLSGNMGLV